MRRVCIVVLAVVGFAGAGCKKGGGEAAPATPCVQLIDREVQCDFRRRSTFDSTARKIFVDQCEQGKDNPGYRAALDCLARTDCLDFNACMEKVGID